MHVIRDWRHVPERWRGAVAAIGNFDGVHRGHQALIGRAMERAAGRPAGAVVFEPHPVEYFKPDAPSFRLTPFDAKARLLSARGLDVLFALRFDQELATMSAENFVRDVLRGGLGLAAVVVGADFQFGKGRKGNLDLLRREGEALGLGVECVDPVILKDDAKVSSTLIREALKNGRPRDAARDLGHWWTVEGHVTRGDQRGRTIGFPTANLALKGTIEPALGVYAVRVTVEDEAGAKTYDGVANFGRRPTFDKKDVLLEVHLFDFAGDLYGKRIAVAFVEFVRPERKFDGLESLKTQIAADCEAARTILAATTLP
ncbi:MAG: bifunctional riboflavin kinase/FAD synthetase [Alphaproteobacteria bacterium]|nr:bifunctional riboflavin kinase/FAD synthetase [Alphaproteobacteria bacterium]